MRWKQTRRICCACGLHTPLGLHTVLGGGGGDGECDMTVMMMSIRRRSISDQVAKCCYIYELKRGQCGVQLSSTIQIGAFNTGGFHPLVVSLVGAIQNNMLDSRANPTKKASHRGMRKTGEENEPEAPRHARMYKNRPIRGMIGVYSAPATSGRSPFFLSLPHPKPLHRRYLNMSGANVLAGAHHFVANNSTFNNAHTVSKMVIVSMYQ